MPQKQLQLDTVVDGQPGDTFIFDSTSSWTQFHFETNIHNPSVVIGIWDGEARPGHGVARNHPGKNYVDHRCGKGRFEITVANSGGPYKIRVRANSWWKSIFG